jgi:VWFA-related protein
VSRAFLRAVLTLASLSTMASAQTEAPPAAGRSVSIYVTALDKQEKLVTTLGREDVRVLDEGVAVSPSDVRVQRDAPLFLAVVIDTSESQRGVLGGTKLAADIFVRGMMRPGQDRAALVTFSNEATLEQAMTADAAKVRGAIMLVAPANPSPIGGILITGGPPPRGSLPGSSSVWDAVWTTATDVLPRSLGTGRRALILLTDGVDTASRVKMDEAVRAALGSEAVVYAIGVRSKGFEADRGALRKLAERTGGRAFFPKKVDELTAIFTQIREELLAQHVLTFTTPAAAHDGAYRKLTVELINPELKRQGVRLSFPHGYFVGNAPTALPAKP